MTQVDASPFDLRPETESGAAALCLHGLTGTPYEVRPVGEALARRGIRARGPALPGHNDTPENLARLSYTAWLDAAREHHEALREEHDRVYITGLSLGGLITLAMAAEGRGDAVAVIGTPLRFKPTIGWLIPVIKYLRPYLAKDGGSDIRDAAARDRHPGYPVMPLQSVHELIRLQSVVQRGLRAIEMPILVAHGAHDTTAAPSDAHDIAARVSSREKQLLVLEDSAHVVPVDVDGVRVSEAIAEFLTVAR